MFAWLRRRSERLPLMSLSVVCQVAAADGRVVKRAGRRWTTLRSTLTRRASSPRC